MERLEKLSLKEWNKLVRNKQFNWDDGIRTKIIKMRSQGKKFEDWVVETKDIDDGDLGEIEPSVITSAMAAAIAACTAKDAVLLPLGSSSSNVFLIKALMFASNVSFVFAGAAAGASAMEAGRCVN